MGSRARLEELRLKQSQTALSPRARLNELRQKREQVIAQPELTQEPIIQDGGDFVPPATGQEIPAGAPPQDRQDEGFNIIPEALQPGATLLSTVAAQPVSGLAGLATLPFAGSEEAAKNVKRVQDALTLLPKSEEGMRRLQQFADLLEPAASTLQETEQFLGDVGAEIAGPVGGAIGKTIPTAVLSLTGAGGARKTKEIARATRAPIEGTLKDALNKGTVLTSDVIPPKTFVGKAFQKVTERVPVIGTGKVRAAQQKTRIDALDDIAKEFNIDPGVAFEKNIVNSASNVFKKSQKRAATLRTEALKELDTVGDVNPVNALKTIDDEMAKITSLGARGDAELLNTLANIKGELAGDFSRLKNIRTTIFDDIADIGSAKSAIKSGGDSVLTTVAGSLSKDLDDFATSAGKLAGDNRELAKAASKWKASNRIFKDNFAKAKDTELKRALTKGKLQPEVVNTTIKGGKSSELQRLHNNLDLSGREAVRQQILKTALEKANGNPTRFLNDLNSVNNRKAIDVFFKGRSRREIDGVKKFLNITRRAQEEAASIATQAEASTIGLVGGAALAPKPVIAGAVVIGGLGRAFESKAVRNLLVKLSRVKSNSKQASLLTNELTPLIGAFAQAAKETKKEDNK